jgi:hypothetical protein
MEAEFTGLKGCAQGQILCVYHSNDQKSLLDNGTHFHNHLVIKNEKRHGFSENTNI